MLGYSAGIRRGILSSLAITLGVALTIAARADEDRLATPIHLVGHEEAGLLLRVQDVIDDWDPRKLVNPLVETSEAAGEDGAVTARKQLRRSDLAEFIADIGAAEALGKAFFWEMQAGSDFRRTADGKFVGTACASCHYRAGADARGRYTTRLPYVAWDGYKLDKEHPLEFGERQHRFDVKAEAVREVAIPQYRPAGPFSLIVGSQGVEPQVFAKLNADPNLAPGWTSEISRKRSLSGFEYKPEWSMFIEGQAEDGQRYRQITNRNSPTVINQGFSNRLFHDGRAESTFNGFSIFGDSDPREVIHRSEAVYEKEMDGKLTERRKIIPTRVAITNAALASQAVGPIVNDIEMSYVGRTFPNVACKLLDAKILPYQEINEHDSVLGPWKKKNLIGAQGTLKYRDLIKRAFRRDWWDGEDVPLILLRESDEDGRPRGSLMEANFSLYWGLGIMLYEASLVSNQSPFDDMMLGRSDKVEEKWEKARGALGPITLDRASVPPNATPAPTHSAGTAAFQHGFRVFLNRGCVECHSGPLFSELYERLPEAEKLPIAYTMERVLLPNPMSDALALKLQDRRNHVLKDVADEIAAREPGWKARSGKIALELDLLRELARGNKDLLFRKIQSFFEDEIAKAGPPMGVAKEYPSESVQLISDKLMGFEKGMIKEFGNRTFFTEDERVAMAEQLGEPVLVEKMNVPPDQKNTRPRLPILGPLARDTYAFYDLAFYNLGVAPPRYDRGIGEKDGEQISIAVAMKQAIEKLENSTDANDKALGERARSVLGRDPDEEIISRKMSPLEATKPMEEAVRDKFTEQEQDRLDKSVETIEAIKDGSKPASSSPGNAYRFKREWFQERFKSDLDAEGNEKEAHVRNVAPATNTRTCADGPNRDPDRDHKAAASDTSWDRDDLPGNARRSTFHFRSRARELVTNEEPWGYRKPLLHDNELAFWGAFRTPTLRNVELTGPYMHNGRLMTLRDVVDFYVHKGAGEFEDDGDVDEIEKDRFIPRHLLWNPDKHPAIVELKMTESDKRALVFFLMCLTDERVRTEQAPFDHPSLELVNGYEGEDRREVIVKIGAVGAGGNGGKDRGVFPSNQ